MNIDKELLSKRFKENDMEYVFKQAEDITNYLIVHNFKIYNEEIKNDMCQECLLNFWKKVQQGKCDPDNNVFSFIWQNSTWRILEILRKERNRNEKVKFVCYDDTDENNYSNFIDSKFYIGDRYSVEIP